MADTEQEIYDQSVAEQTESPVVTPTEAPTEAKVDRSRDDMGRYVKASPEPVATEEPVSAPVETQPEAEKPESEGRVPSWRLAEESQRRRDAEQGLAEVRAELRQMQMQMQRSMQPPAAPPPEAPDIFGDPQGFVNHMQTNFDQRIKTLQLENSLRFAHYAHGDVFDKAYSDFTDHVQRSQDQATYQRVMASPDPGEALVQWHRERQLQQQLGGSDLNSFLDKQKEEWAKDPAFQAKVIEAFKATQNATAPSNVNLPPSLSRATAAHSAHESLGTSGQDMYSYATKRR